MYVVKRPFRNFGKMLVAGTVIQDPATVKRFKVRLSEGNILEVTEANKKSYAEYFKLKYGVDILEEPKVLEAPKAPVKVSQPVRTVVVSK